MNKGTLRSQIEGPLNKGEENLSLREISNFSGWNWGNISFAFPKSLALEMKAIPLPFSNQGEDRLSWFSSPNGDFKLKEAYRLANKGDNNMVWQHFKGDWVWKVATLPKIKCFLWQCCHQSIPVRALLAQRGMDIPFLCPVFNHEPETILHALRDCPKAQSFWNSLSPPFRSNLFYGLQLVDWLKLNCKTSMSSPSSNINWSILFPFAVWTFWLHRNCIAFDNPHQHKDLKRETMAKASEFLYLGMTEKHNPVKAKIQVQWLPPPVNWVKLNSDGSSMGNPGLAGGGGLIRNERGEWIKGYARAIGITTSVAAELWALRDGICLCSALNFPAVIVELDSKLVVDLLNKELDNPNGIDVLVSDCRESLKAIPCVRIQHCYREANKCADALARRGALLSQDFSILIFPPPDVALLLSLDSAGALYDRFVPSVLEAG